MVVSAPFIYSGSSSGDDSWGSIIFGVIILVVLLINAYRMTHTY